MNSGTEQTKFAFAELGQAIQSWGGQRHSLEATAARKDLEVERLRAIINTANVRLATGGYDQRERARVELLAALAADAGKG
jgi:hypothetical protein